MQLADQAEMGLIRRIPNQSECYNQAGALEARFIELMDQWKQLEES
ncbi:MAG: hypothetical protein ACJ0Q6_05330 [Candidatus Azotimanducaceae bacterium]